MKKKLLTVLLALRDTFTCMPAAATAAKILRTRKTESGRDVI